MRALWAGETVTHHGLVTVEEARLYSRPAKPPLLVRAALTPATAEWLGGWADALVTTGQPRPALDRIVDAFRRGGGEGKPLFLQVQLSYAASEAQAGREAHGQWRSLMAGSSVLANLPRAAPASGRKGVRMSAPIGRTRWAIAEGYIPSWSHGPEPQLTSHETACLLNASDRDAEVAITLYFEDRERVGPYRLTLPARRTRHVRFNELQDPEPVPVDTPFASLIESSLPIVVQHTRLDSRQAENAIMTTMAFPADS